MEQEKCGDDTQAIIQPIILRGEFILINTWLGGLLLYEVNKLGLDRKWNWVRRLFQ